MPRWKEMAGFGNLRPPAAALHLSRRQILDKLTWRPHRPVKKVPVSTGSRTAKSRTTAPQALTNPLMSASCRKGPLLLQSEQRRH